MVPPLKRPVTVTVISFIFMIAGVTGIVYHAAELKNITSDLNIAWVLLVRLAAVAGGWFVLRDRKRARWLLIIWILYHVFVSFYDMD